MKPEAASAGGLVAAVEPESIGEEIGIEPGDRLVSINGQTLRDVIDYRFYAAEEHLVLVVERGGERYEIEVERDYDEALGLEFAESLFDGLRECNNRCPFCFVQQMPRRSPGALGPSARGLRRSLYVRDDDYRYSFLLGNFVTLTNLDEEDWARIAEQRLSPLYVSIHATDDTVRRRLLGNESAPAILPQLRRLAGMGIQMHGQIVIVPGLNDGDVLRRSVTELLALWPALETLALVPVGLTRFHRGGLRTLEAEEARAILAIAHGVMPTIREATGGTWLFPADELYLLAGQPVPDRTFYDTGAQRENGIGLVRELLDDWRTTRLRLGHRPEWPPHVTLACGTLIWPFLREMAAALSRLSGLSVEAIPVANRFFGETVTVSGLLTGQDVLDQLKGRVLGACLFLPSTMFESSGQFTLDGLTLEDLRARLDVPIVRVTAMSEVVEQLDEMAQHSTV